MSYIEPANFVTQMIDQGESKLNMSEKDVLIRGFMAGALLGLAAFFAINIVVNTENSLIGAMLFPVGFIMLYLMKFDLLTGVFTLTPLAVMDGRPGACAKLVVKNWILVFIGNLSGSLFIAVFATFIITFGYNIDGGDLSRKLASIGESRTLGYKEFGLSGWVTVFIRGILCNWMVSMGVVGSMMSSSANGKILAMWMPIMLFFYMGFEHSIVNMFLFPYSLILGGEFTVTDYLLWNELPTILGNLVGGLLLVGLPLYFTHKESNS